MMTATLADGTGAEVEAGVGVRTGGRRVAAGAATGVGTEARTEIRSEARDREIEAIVGGGKEIGAIVLKEGEDDLILSNLVEYSCRRYSAS